MVKTIRSILCGHVFELGFKGRELGALFSLSFSSDILFVSRSIKIGRSLLAIFLSRLRFLLVAVRFINRFSPSIRAPQFSWYFRAPWIFWGARLSSWIGSKSFCLAFIASSAPWFLSDQVGLVVTCRCHFFCLNILLLLKMGLYPAQYVVARLVLTPIDFFIFGDIDICIIGSYSMSWSPLVL